MDLTEFAEEVGTSDPVTIAGMSTRGGPVPEVRTVMAPSGIEWVKADEMTVSCGAGTSMAELDAALDLVGQYVVIPPFGTVGGALSLGQSGIRRLGHGPTRDAVLQIRYVSAAGEVIQVGGPTVKNVTGFDLCRLMVGSRGTLGFLGDVILRTQPRAPFEQWYCRDGQPWDLLRLLYRPVSLLWDGERSYVLLEGDVRDVQREAANHGLTASDAPDTRQFSYRWSVPPSSIAASVAMVGAQPGEFLAEVGVGVIHLRVPAPPASVSPEVLSLHRRIKHNLDPTGRLNPGVDVLDGAVQAVTRSTSLQTQGE
jgi:FAD/FMN-containing dehydrogenase